MRQVPQLHAHRHDAHLAPGLRDEVSNPVKPEVAVAQGLQRFAPAPRRSFDGLRLDGFDGFDSCGSLAGARACLYGGVLCAHQTIVTEKVSQIEQQSDWKLSIILWQTIHTKGDERREMEKQHDPNRCSHDCWSHICF